MKLHILSDIHLEFEPFEIPQTDADLIILAGDIGIGTKGLEWAAFLATDKPIIYINGNHEYYRYAHPKLVKKMREIEFEIDIKSRPKKSRYGFISSKPMKM